MICASFDIGKKNFAFYIESFNLDNLPFQQQIIFNKDGTPCEMTKLIIDKVCKEGKTLLHRNYDLSLLLDNNQKKKQSLKIKIEDYKLFYNMTLILNKYKEFWTKCDYFVIEQQMCFQSVRNTLAVKLAQHCFSYFTIFYGDIQKDKIIEFPAFYKTQLLGAPKIKGNKIYKNGNHSWKSMTKPARKKWAIKKATEILKLRNRDNIMEQYKKKDDLADTLIQLQAFKIHHFVKKNN